MKPKFDESILTATQWSTTKDKIRFANQFVKFVESGYSSTQFPKWFYARLSMCFGFIAHYNRGGFYEFYFEENEEGNRQEAIDQVINYPCYGNPAYTFSDIEKQIQLWYREYMRRN